jgi:anhydro-N-acetylmuramic acid kinase
MSGTSLDGIDLAFCTFNKDGDKFIISNASTYPYDLAWKNRLRTAHLLNGQDLAALDAELSTLFSSTILAFIKDFNLDLESIDAIASHGHTIFHQPEKGFTLQIGKSSYIAAKTGIKVISDFRSADIALGGQGAPLVPIGDFALFSNFTNRINLGGFANISFEEDATTYAYDICPANMALNQIANKLGHAFDDNGSISRSGKVDSVLLKKLNELNYYLKKHPKSLGLEWYTAVFNPILKNSTSSYMDILRTLVEHISIQISNSMIQGDVLISGGGAHNAFLIERIEANCSNTIILPEDLLIDFKEALIFAYLGNLRLQNKINVLSSVTGANRDHCAGNIHLP